MLATCDLLIDRFFLYHDKTLCDAGCRVCARMIDLEIKHALSCLLQNNIRDGEMLFEIEKPRR